LELDVLDHTTLSRRTRGLVCTLAPRCMDRPLNLVLDVTVSRPARIPPRQLGQSPQLEGLPAVG
ncbi:MAG: hypothetical protein AAF211_15095, partial [Myxococcota bacterium]